MKSPNRQTDGLITAKRIIIAKSYENLQVSHVSTCSLVIKRCEKWVTRMLTDCIEKRMVATKKFLELHNMNSMFLSRIFHTVIYDEKRCAFLKWHGCLKTTQAITKLSWTTLHHSCYIPGMIPSDFHVCAHEGDPPS